MANDSYLQIQQTEELDAFAALDPEAEAREEARQIINATPAITEPEKLPEKQKEVIFGLIRRGGKLLITGASKAGKSYLAIELGVAVATGGRWMGFDCAAGRVLYLNLEIEQAEFFDRVYRVHEKLGTDGAAVSSRFHVSNLRGRFSRIEDLADCLTAAYGPGDYDLLIIDPVYKVQPGSENDAESITAFVAQLDRLAEELACTIAYVHHHSKGAQGGKNAADRGSGSGVFARDVDALVDMTELDPSEAAIQGRRELGWNDATPYRLEFVVRSFKKPEPVDVWYRCPLHELDVTHELADCRTKAPGGARAFHQEQADRLLIELEEALDAFMGDREEIETRLFVEHVGKDPRTVRKHLKRSRRFVLESSSNASTIRRAEPLL